MDPTLTNLARTLEPLIPALRRYARALLRNRWDADDLVQDCLERAISRWHQRRDDASTRAWLFAILHNLAMTRLQRAARLAPTVALEDIGELDIARASELPDPLAQRDILVALARLPEAQRALLLLVGVEDLSYAEAARVLDIPLGTVMSRLSRARERLRDILSEPATPHRRPTLRSVT